MSHYTVGVIIDKNIEKAFIEGAVDKALAPFDEDLVVAPYVSKTKEALEKEHQEILEVMKIKESKKYNVEYLLENKEKYETFEAYLESNYGDRDFDNDGNLLSSYNPNSKWDWFTIGGRWEQSVPLKNGKMANIASIKDIKLKVKFTEKQKKGKLDKYNELITDGDLITPESYKERFPTFEDYLDYQATFSTCALLDSKGVWHEAGRMGWFGCSSASPEDELNFTKNFISLLEKEDQDNYFVLVDCHI